MALASAIVCLVDFAFIHILPFMPTAISKDTPLPNSFRRGHSEFKILTTKEVEYFLYGK